MSDLAEVQKAAWLAGGPFPVCANSQVRAPLVRQPRALDLDAVLWDEVLDDWPDAGDYCAVCGRAWCDCAARDAELERKLREATWADDEPRRVGLLQHLELGPAPCPACHGDCVCWARERGCLVVAGVCARCRGKGVENA